jgi:pyridoxamine 5'-phosphate oxidase
VEFWQGRENRVHNRIRLHFEAGGEPAAEPSRIERLQP